MRTECPARSDVSVSDAGSLVTLRLDGSTLKSHWSRCSVSGPLITTRPSSGDPGRTSSAGMPLVLGAVDLYFARSSDVSTAPRVLMP